MVQFGAPLLFALILWWVSTGAILWLVRRPRESFRFSLLVYSAVAGATLAGLTVSARDTGVSGAYGGFFCALVIWGWHEMGFLMGVVTGPRRTVCPPDARGWARFRAAAETLIHHEIALMLTAIVIVLLTWDAPNQTGTLTFLLLLGMRLSTKLNIFLGVANPPNTFLPEPIAYLHSYFRRRRFNALFPLSLALSVGVTWLLARLALDPEASAGDAAGFALLFGLAALGVLEHAFLMTPSPDRALWGWALGPARKTKTTLALAGESEQ